MIIGIGVDMVDVVRFSHWHTRSITSLRRIFSDEEIEYCLKDIRHSAERFAVRFAAREAFYKAICSSTGANRCSFWRVMRAVTVIKKGRGAPYLVIDWDYLMVLDTCMLASIWHITLSHTETMATAFVVGESRETNLTNRKTLL
jgi:holo-[acyl-carrier protein] synthase